MPTLNNDEFSALIATPVQYSRSMGAPKYVTTTASEVKNASGGYKFEKHECVVEVFHTSTTLPAALSGPKVMPCYPEEVQSAVNAIWSGPTIIGRTGTLAAYTGTSDVTTTFNIELHRELEGGDVGNIEKLIAYMKAGCYPKYSSGALLPPVTIFKFGNMWMRGRLSSVTDTWKLPIIDKQYAICSVAISMTSIDSRIIDASDFLSGSAKVGMGHFI